MLPKAVGRTGRPSPLQGPCRAVAAACPPCPAEPPSEGRRGPEEGASGHCSVRVVLGVLCGWRFLQRGVCPRPGRRAAAEQLVLSVGEGL